jgi:hypothetical protein
LTREGVIIRGVGVVFWNIDDMAISAIAEKLIALLPNKKLLLGAINLL